MTRREGAEGDGPRSRPPFNFHYICSQRFRFSCGCDCGYIAIDVLLCALSSIWVLLRFEIYAKYSLSQPSTQPHSAQIMSKPAFPATFTFLFSLPCLSFCLPTSSSICGCSCNCGCALHLGVCRVPMEWVTLKCLSSTTT